MAVVICCAATPVDGAGLPL